MMAKRKAERWMESHEAPSAIVAQILRHIVRQIASGLWTRWRNRESQLIEAFLEATTIAGLFALLFALFVLFAAAQTLTP
ncbi:hypothetical protein [Azospirillum sp. B510]|uniref:hypothetical protein n=1 Tax=Azospirillum sp. (strain B510) TaxID=137722 RepID=UPI00030F2B1F|nr:hypothetical protein [Azospirillum sp. B510]